MYILYVCTLHNSIHIVHSTFSFSRTWPQDALALTGLATGAKNIRVVPEKEIVRLEMTVPHGAMVTSFEPAFAMHRVLVSYVKLVWSSTWYKLSVEI